MNIKAVNQKLIVVIGAIVAVAGFATAQPFMVIPDPGPKSITIRIEPHAKREVFTLDRIDADGRATTSSTILYFDAP
jgi:hypothetical protein